MASYQRPEVIAKIFQVSVRRVQQLTQEGVIESHKVEGAQGRQYDLMPTIQAYISYLSDKAYGKSKSDKENELKRKKLEVEIALKESQNELHRLKTDIQAGRYIAVEEARADYQRFFIVLKKFISAVPNRVGVMLNGYAEPLQIRQIEKDVTRELGTMLTAFVVAAAEVEPPTEVEAPKTEAEPESKEDEENESDAEV